MAEYDYYPDLSMFVIGFEYEILNPDYQGQSDGNEWKKRNVLDESIRQEIINAWKYFRDYRVKK